MPTIRYLFVSMMIDYVCIYYLALPEMSTVLPSDFTDSKLQICYTRDSRPDTSQIS